MSSAPGQSSTSNMLRVREYSPNLWPSTVKEDFRRSQPMSQRRSRAIARPRPSCRFSPSKVDRNAIDLNSLVAQTPSLHYSDVLPPSPEQVARVGCSPRRFTDIEDYQPPLRAHGEPKPPRTEPPPCPTHPRSRRPTLGGVRPAGMRAQRAGRTHRKRSAAGRTGTSQAASTRPHQPDRRTRRGTGAAGEAHRGLMAELNRP
jgi:hypothetical protein